MGTIYDWETLNRVVDELGLTAGADGKIDTSGLGKNEAKLVNDLHSLYESGEMVYSPFYSYQEHSPAAERTNILKQKLEKYKNTINKRYGLSNEGASERAILKAQQDAAKRIEATTPATSGGGSGGGDYSFSLEADAEAVFEEYYNAVQESSGASAKSGTSAGVANNAYTGDEKDSMTLVESDAVKALLGRYKEFHKIEDKGALEEQIYSEAYGKLNSEAAYKALHDGIALIDKEIEASAKSKSAYDVLVEILEEGTPEYFTRKNEELYADLVGDDKEKFDELVDKYMAAEDERSKEANIWYEALGGDGASIEDLQMLLDKFPDASDSFRLALFDLIERKQLKEPSSQFLKDRAEQTAIYDQNEAILADLIAANPKTEDMDTVTAEEFLKAVDEFLDEDGNLDTSKVRQEWWDKNIADRYAEVWEEFGEYFEEEKTIDEETHTKQLAGEKAIVGEDGKEWYILPSGENDAAEFLAKPENREEANEALAEQGYGNLKNPRIPSGVIIEVDGAHLMYDDGQWRYLTNNKNAYKDYVVVNGEKHWIGKELAADEVAREGLKKDPGRNVVHEEIRSGIKRKFVYFNGKWYATQ